MWARLSCHAQTKNRFPLCTSWMWSCGWPSMYVVQEERRHSANADTLMTVSQGATFAFGVAHNHGMSTILSGGATAVSTLTMSSSEKVSASVRWTMRFNIAASDGSVSASINSVCARVSAPCDPEHALGPETNSYRTFMRVILNLMATDARLRKGVVLFLRFRMTLRFATLSTPRTESHRGTSTVKPDGRPSVAIR